MLCTVTATATATATVTVTAVVAPLSRQSDPGIPCVEGDAGRISLIMNNLLANAVKVSACLPARPPACPPGRAPWPLPRRSNGSLTALQRRFNGSLTALPQFTLEGTVALRVETLQRSATHIELQVLWVLV